MCIDAARMWKRIMGTYNNNNDTTMTWPLLTITESQNYDEPKSGGQYDIPRGVSSHFKALSLSDCQYDFPSTGKAALTQSSEYDAPAARSAVAPLKAASLYDKPPNQLNLSTLKVSEAFSSGKSIFVRKKKMFFVGKKYIFGYYIFSK